MKHPKLASLVLALAATLSAPNRALADTSSDIAALRREIDAIRVAYDGRLLALEQQLQAAEARRSAAAAAAASAAPLTAPPAASLAAPSAAPPAAAIAAPSPAAAGAPAAANAFNPALSLILSGLVARTSQDPAKARITGFQLPPGAAVGAGTRGFSLGETELGLAASIDPWWRGAASIALHADNSVSVEEAAIQSTALGHGLVLKAGRFFSGLGYLNAQHAHAWDFVDNPLVYQALLGTQLADDGVQMTWLAPTDRFIELGIELGRGRGFPGADNGRNGAGMAAMTAHTGGDWGDSHTWRAGVSLLSAKANAQQLAGQGANDSAARALFSGRTRVWVADAVWKWAPNGNASRTSFKLQGEYLRSTRSGSLEGALGAADGAAPYRTVQSGWYVQGVYQFMAQWRVGLRSERLDPGRASPAGASGLFAPSQYRPQKQSLMVDFNPSEFSRVRLQLAQDRSRQGVSDAQIFLQYQMSLGAHGAHGY